MDKVGAEEVWVGHLVGVGAVGVAGSEEVEVEVEEANVWRRFLLMIWMPISTSIIHQQQWKQTEWSGGIWVCLGVYPLLFSFYGPGSDLSSWVCSSNGNLDIGRQIVNP